VNRVLFHVLWSRMQRGRRGADKDQESEQQRKLFLGGLSLTTTEEGLREYFGQWGTLVDVVVMKDRHTNRSRGFGFVTYSSPEMVDAAQSNRPHDLDGRTVESKRAMPREDSHNPEAHLTVNKLFVGSLKKEMTSDDLRDYFSKFGNVTDCEIMLWKETGESRGFGFITFDDYDPVDKAMVSKPHYIKSNRVEVKKALSKEQINDAKRKQEYHRDPYPQSRSSDRFERMPQREMGMLGPNRYDSMLRGADPWMENRYSSSLSQSAFGGMSGWGYDSFGSRGGGMRDMGFGDFGEQRRFSGGPMRNADTSFRNAPYKGDRNGRGRR
jgi:heterogeneous nuclear ribonucleoprotein A1/A3